jgi:hypothetical protein
VKEISLTVGKSSNLQEQKQNEMATLLVALNANLDKVGKEFANDPRAQASAEKLQKTKELYTRLSVLLYSM